MKQVFRILVVEDDPDIMTNVHACLSGAGYRVLQATEGPQGLSLALAEAPDLVLLDVMLPKMDGFEICAELREKKFNQPILMLTTRSEIADRVKGLSQGADDYLGKPFDTRELLARVHALLRRFRHDQSDLPELKFDGVLINLKQQTATRHGHRLVLTKTEFALLEMLAASAGEPVSRDQMLAGIWGYTYLPNTRTVDTHIWRLRKKIGDDGEVPKWIKSMPGKGYLLALD